MARSPATVGLVSGSCSSARVFAPRFFQAPPRGECCFTFALRYDFTSIKLSKGLSPSSCRTCSAHQKRGPGTSPEPFGESEQPNEQHLLNREAQRRRVRDRAGSSHDHNRLHARCGVVVTRAAAATNGCEQQPENQDGGTQCPYSRPPTHALLAPLSRPIDQTEQTHTCERSQCHITTGRYIRRTDCNRHT